MKRRAAEAVTIVELLAVVAILAIVLAMVAPSADRAMRGTALTQSGQMVGDQIAAARQAAIARNQVVFVRFYKMPRGGVDDGEEYCAVQVLCQDAAGDLEPLSKPGKLHENVRIAESARYSTLVSQPTVSGSDTLGGRSAEYAGFRFLPDGSTDLDLTFSDGWFVTLANRHPPLSEGDVPKNFYTIRVDPHTGRTRTFRP